MRKSRIPRVTRRQFLKETGLTLAAATAAPVISAPFVSRALADTKSLSIVQWSHFVPEYDKWFDNFAKDWGDEEQDFGHGRPHPGRQRRRARRRRSLGWIGSRSVRMERLRRRASLSQIPGRRDEPRRGDREEVRQGQHDRPPDRLQPGRQDLVGLPRFLHQLPLPVSQEHVGRDRDEAGHLGQRAHRRRQAEGQGPPGRHFARPQQRPEHDLARPAVEPSAALFRTRRARKSCSTARRRSKPSSSSPRSTRRR